MSRSERGGRSSVSPRAARAGLVLVALAGWAVYLWARHRTLNRLLLALGFGAVPLHDYAYFFYPTGARIFRDPTPVEGFLYSPFAALFFAPFGALPYRASAAAWAAVLAASVALLAYESARPFRGGGRPYALAAALTLGAVPVLHNLKFGQVSVPTVAALLLCVTLYERGRKVPAAACLTFAASFKFYPLAFLSYFVFKRDGRFLAAAAAFCLLAFVALPALALGPAAAIAFYGDVFRQIGERFGAGVADVNSQSFQSVLGRLAVGRLARLAPGVPWAAALTLLRYALCGLALWVVAALAADPRRRAARYAFLWVFACTPLFVATSWPHYFAYLPAVLVATLAALPRAPRLRRPAAFCAVAGALLSNIVVFDLIGNRFTYARSGALFFADLLALLALALVLRGRAGVEALPAQPPRQVGVRPAEPSGA
ncbi:MAG TPA: glycosyltransferase family 87 protein [Polyangiaceae bacterium]|nr:glycosyltransferase family 87 protein [Polyangiaceae bacterium]